MRRCSLVVSLALAAACGDNHAPDVVGPVGPVEVSCAVLAPTATTCTVTPGSEVTLLTGNVLTATTLFRGGQVAVDATGTISCVGCNCATGGETTVTCPGASISPGLINAHDHITFDQNPPYTDTGERYEDRQQWRLGLDARKEIPAAGGATADQIRWAELRFLMGGATSIVGSGGQKGLLRNLDQAANLEGITKKEVEFQTFPLNDAGGRRRIGDCNYGGMPDTPTKTSVAAADAYEPHTAEGINQTARNEFLCQTSTTFDTSTPGVSNSLLLPKTAMIHAIGLTAGDYAAMASGGTSLIWSPRSNITLYGDTARVTTAARLGVRIALGTDWLPSGSMNVLRELACADSFNTTYLERYFRDDELWAMVTGSAAGVTATSDVIGALEVGKVADIAIFAGNAKPPFRAVIEAEPKDVALVMRGGKVLYGDADAVGALAQTCDPVDVCSTAKRVCLMAEVGKTYDALRTAVQPRTGAAYPAFACGVPANEPSCTPRRPVAVAGSTIYTGMPSASDSDGDGIADSADSCPRTFNPIRPMDGGAQGDADNDGAGDACDPCPFDARSTACTAVSTGDRDLDRTASTADNCPETTNPDQADADKDKKGDACDLCPMAANPGGMPCPTTIYAIKAGSVLANSAVRLTNALITGVGSNGFFVQVKETDPGYTGPDNSGLFVFTGTPLPAAAVVGARVTLDGSATVFQGQTELEVAAADIVTIAAGPEAPPAPIAVTYNQIRTGGPRSVALESVLVTLGPSTVTATNAGFGEITVDDGAANTLVVDDFVSPITPLPLAPQGYTSVTGILAFRQMASKLQIRSAADLVLGKPGIAAFGPAKAFARIGAGAAAPTIPQPLTVTLTGPSQGTTVTLVSGTPTSLTVVDVVVPDGQTTAQVPVTALVKDADVLLTATATTQTLGPRGKDTHVQVLDAADAPTKVTLTGPPTIHPNETLTYAATLDIPALVDATVPVTLTPANAGTLTPASPLSILANQQVATFTFRNTLLTGTVDLQATFGAASTLTLIVSSAPDHLVISQVYGGGGNSGATLKNDFIELHNPTPVAVALNGMSVQYTSAAGTTWQLTALPDVMVPPGGFVLVGQAAGAGGTVDLPTPDVVGTIPMGGAAGKIALVNSATALAGACPAGLVDLVGYGATMCFEGAGPTPAPSNTLAVLRAMNGCQDNDDNAADFTAGAPAPRNSATAPATCQ
jgi:large repetitive protein